MDFRFLSLPAELRNRVYVFAGDFEKLARVTRTPVPSYKVSIPRTRIPWDTLSRVCRQIRGEYRDLHRHEARLQVNFDELPAFLDTFYGSAADRTLLPRDLVIAVPPYKTFEGQFGAVDFLPLLTLQTNAPGRNCEFRTSDLSNTEERWFQAMFPRFSWELSALNKVLHNENEKWLQDIRSGGLDSVKVGRLDDEALFIQVLFKPGHEPNGFRKHTSRESRTQAKKAYATAVGMKDRHMRFGVAGDIWD